MIETITIQTAAKAMNFDIRTLKNWCRLNQLIIYCPHGTRKKYLIKAQFEFARFKKFIGQKVNKKVSGGGKEKYTPMGNHEKSFLERLAKK